MSAESLRVLIVDDNIADGRVLRALLEQTRTQCERINISHARTVCEGLAQLDCDPFDCLFVDYALKDGSGLELIHQIRKSGNDVPVVAVSGVGCEQIAVDTLKLGAQEYLVKGSLTPIAVDRALCNAIDKVAYNRKLAARDQELEAFVQVAAHDMRAPLRQIVANYNIIMEDCSDEIGDLVERRLKSIGACAVRMETLLESLLEFSQFNQSQCELSEVDLTDVLEDALDNLALVIDQRDARVSVGPLPEVMGRRVALIQLFQNLVANAIKFCPESSPVVEINSSEGKPGGSWIISVQDNGIGIDQKYFDRIFAPFQRLHRKEQFEGSGIGLATCKRIIEQHEGEIKVKSTVGEGTTFQIKFPKPLLGQSESDEIRIDSMKAFSNSNAVVSKRPNVSHLSN